MEIKFSCTNPACQQHIAVDESLAGRPLSCPTCGTMVQVPNVPVPATASPPAQSSATPRSASPASQKDAIEEPFPFSARLKRLLLGWCAGAALLGLLLGGLHLRAKAALPRQFDRMVEEICSAGDIRMEPLVNHEGTRLLYARNVEDGVGIILLDLATLKQTQLGVAIGPERAQFDFFNLFGWSPDDRVLAFSRTAVANQGNLQIEIRDGATGALVKSTATRESIRQAAWLSPNSLVLYGRSHQLYLLNLKADAGLGQFGAEGIVDLRHVDAAVSRDDSSYGITCPSDNTIAFVEHGNLWSLDVRGNQLRQRTHFSNATVEWPDYDRTSDRFLLCVTGPTTRGLRLLHRLDVRAPTEAEGLTRITDTPTLEGQWIGEGTGIAYVSSGTNGTVLAVEPKDEAQRTNLFAGGHIRGFSAAPKGDKLYVVAAQGPEPVGIWEYNIAQRDLRNVVSGMERPRVASQIIAPVRTVLTNQTGERVKYFYLPPAGFDSRKRYPAVIDRPIDDRWERGSQVLANAGIFYFSANRSRPNGVEDYGRSTPQLVARDALALFNELQNHPNVDPHRIYISGLDWSTYVFTRMLDNDNDSTPWRGVLLLSPVAYPKIPANSAAFPSVFVSVGLKEREERVAGSKTFLQEACRNLIPARVVYHQEAALKFENNRLFKERYRAAAEFILADY